MTQRKPIVIVDGRQQQIQSGDTLGGISSATSAGEAMVYDQFGANASHMTPTGDPTFDAITGTSDATINGLTVGRGAGAIASNTSVGSSALGANTTGFNNVAAGYNALTANTTGFNNVAAGYLALTANTTGYESVAVGVASLGDFSADAGFNVAVGMSALRRITAGSNNTGIGAYAAFKQADGATDLTGANNSIYVGSSVRGYNNSDSYAIVIGAGAIGEATTGIVIGSSNNTVSHLFGTPTFSDGSDATKKLTLSLSGITTGTTRTITLPDASGTMTLLGNNSTGSGSVVLATSPTLVTPNIGAATATSLVCPTFTTSSGAMGFTPAAGSSINITTSGAGDFAVNTNQFYVDSSTGYVGVGVTAPSDKFHVHGDGPISSNFSRASDNTGGFNFLFQKARGTRSAPTLVSAGDTIGNILFQAYNDAYRTCANISAAVETGVGATGADMPGRLVFWTTPDGSATQLERMRIDSAGNVLIGHTGTALGKLESRATSGAQIVASYDASNYATITVASNGATTFDAVGAGAAFTFSDNVSSTGSITSTGTGGVGYATGAGGTVTQATSRTTGVTLNKTTGAITLVSAAGSASWQTFTVTNSTVAATDVIVVNQKSGTDLYMIHVTNVAAGSFKVTFATTGGTTTEQPVFNFAVIKGVTA